MQSVSSTTEPELHFITLKGVELAYWERGEPRTDKPTLLFVHATGFHGRVFDRVLEAFPGFHSIALELRGHGRSQHSPIRHWKTMGEDQIAFLQEKGLTNLIGVGHSMGAHAMIDAAATTGAFARLLLLDPTVPSPEVFAEAPPPDFSQPHPAAKRKKHFDSPEDMRDRILPKGAYHLFEPRILMDYCRYGLLPSAAGGYELACLPEMEASVYQTARTNPGVYDSARSLTIPVTIMRAMEPGPDRDPTDFSISPTWPMLVGEFQNGREFHLADCTHFIPMLVGEFQNGREFHLADCTHFIPMQMPDRVVEVIQEEIAGWEADRSALEGHPELPNPFR